MTNFPDKNKDCTQGVVRLKKTMFNQAGQGFPEGQLMIVSKRKKGDKSVTLRPVHGQLVCSEDDVDFLGKKVELGFEPTQ